MYERHQRPLVRVVQGLSTSWEVVVTSIYHEDLVTTASWSPCNRFIAVARDGAVEIRDAVTLNLLNTFESPSGPGPQLSFSPDSRFLTRFGRADLVTWDLQTGSLVGVGTILPKGSYASDLNSSSAYSADGKMLAVAYSDEPNTFIATHDSSTTHAHLYRVPQGRLIPSIWTHGEFLRFATLEPGYITIREVEFTLAQTPEVVESLPAPDEIADAGVILFLPTLSRLVLAFEFGLLVWDARDSKFLLKTEAFNPTRMPFSSDGRFFACGDHDSVRVWEESPTGYVLHQQLALSPYGGPFLSPNGESIVISLQSTIHLWHTKNPILSGGSILASDHYKFSLEFSPREASAAFARYGKTRVTILDLQSSDPQLEIDVVEEVSCLGITESSTVVVSGDSHSVSTWDLATRNTTAVTRDRGRIAQLDPSPSGAFRRPPFMSVSSDLSRVATVGWSRESQSNSLEIYDVFTGRCLASAVLDIGVSKSLQTPDEFKVVDTG